MESGRERVIKAINHVEPEIVPVSMLGFDPVEPWLRRFEAQDPYDLREKLGLDTQFVRPVYTGPNAARGLDVWGNGAGVTGANGAGYGSAHGDFPLADASTVAEIDSYAWPSPDDFDYAVAAEVLRSVPQASARVIRMTYSMQRPAQSRTQAARSSFAGLYLLCSLFDLFGMEDALAKLYYEPRLIEAAVSQLEAFLLGFEERLLAATRGLADILHFEDDFASQQGMLLSPDHWRRFLKPTYKKIYALARSSGLKLEIHSCGTFRPVLPEMIDMGMDVWEPAQLHLPGNDPAELKREYGQHLTISGGISSQRTLPLGTPEDVRAEVRERIAVLGRGGGYICGPDHTVLADVPPENVFALLEAARTFRFQE